MSEKSPNDKQSKEGQTLVASKGSGDIAVIGEGTPNRTPVSIQVLQGIYHELTGKKEEVSKSYDEPFKVTIRELEQLHLRILQTCEQYQIKGLTTEFKIYYIDDTQDTFSSIERFKAFNAGSDSSVESILFKYNFLILLPKTNQPQSYTITVRIASRIAIDKQMKREMFEMPKILKLIGSRNAIVTIEYIDYVVARTFLNVIDGWFKVLPCTPQPVWLKKIKKYSDVFPLLFKYSVGAIVALIIFQIIPHVLNPASTLPTFANFVFASFVGLFVTYKLGGHLGRMTENSLDDWTPMSYIQLTAGDRKEIDNARTNNRWAIAKVVVSFVGSILISIIVKLIANLIVDLASKTP